MPSPLCGELVFGYSGFSVFFWSSQKADLGRTGMEPSIPWGFLIRSQSQLLIRFVTLEFALILTLIQTHEKFEIPLVFLAYIAASVAYIYFPLFNLLDHKLPVDIKSLNCSPSIL